MLDAPERTCDRCDAALTGGRYRRGFDFYCYTCFNATKPEILPCPIPTSPPPPIPPLSFTIQPIPRPEAEAAPPAPPAPVPPATLPAPMPTPKKPAVNKKSAKPSPESGLPLPSPPSNSPSKPPAPKPRSTGSPPSPSKPTLARSEVARRRAEGQAKILQLLRRGPRQVRDLIAALDCRETYFRVLVAPLVAAGKVRKARDRKSTRLNSSY